MGAKIVVVVACLLAFAAPTRAGQPPSGLCPDGFSETFNINGPGCTFCFAPTDCDIACLPPAACFCPPGDTACCENNRCCDGCAEPKPLECLTGSCSCEPGSCCSTVCPSATRAPAASAGGIGMLVAVLAGLGMATVGLRNRRR